jgi:hypothetical protein
MMLKKVKLANGTEVDWEEFAKWSAVKQHASVIGRSEKTRALLRNHNLGKKQSSDALAKRKASRVANGIDVKGSYKARGLKPNMGKALAVHTPFGTFISKKAAIKAMEKLGVLNAKHRFAEALVNDPKNYYLI